MKKLVIFALIILMLGSCSTYYGKYDYDRYFQNNEPFITLDSEEEAAKFIARKLARRFRRYGRQTLSVLAFTDEYGDRINRGDFFAQMVISGLSRYRNPMVIERESLYEIVKERELTLTNLIDNEGYELNKLLQADYILHGRILRGKHEDMISVRCFKVGTGEVVYASTVSIDYTPDVYVPAPVPPQGPIIIVNVPGHSPKPEPKPDPKPDPEPEIEKPKPKPSDGIENKGKIDLDDQKKSTSDQYQYKKKEVDDPPAKKPSSTTTTDNGTVTVKTEPIKKKTPVKEEVIQEKDPLKEEKKVESKKSSTTTSKKSSTLKK
ncbi:MAG: CsgG/HfaB family protein [Candidatus Marinimicrobia bacterium]|nr:CsgG/HfaB family protein [Candidatus Neomarinimicrobiota bacterium]